MISASLTDKYAERHGPVFMTGVQALVRLPLDRHRRDRAHGLRTATLLSGYPGSPLGGYDLELARQAAELAAHEAVHRPAVNEELAATAVWGSQIVNTLPGARFDGVVGLWYGKAPGLDRASDAMRHGNLAGVARSCGAVALVGDDPMAKSSTVPSASEATLAALQMPVLVPGDVQDVLDLGVHAVALSRSCGLWVGMKVATNVADGFATVEVAPDRLDPVMVEIELDGRPYEQVPTMQLIGERLQTLEYSLAHGRLEAARAYSRANELNRIVHRTAEDRIGLIAAGKTYFDLRQALSDLAISDADLSRARVRILQVRMPSPLDGEVLREFARGLEEIVVIEEKQPFLERLIKDELYNLAERPIVVGKRDEEGRPLVKPDGELDSDSIAEVVGARVAGLSELAMVRERLARLRTLPAPVAIAAARAPYFCSGCPHNTSTTQLPKGAVVGAGIGCHGMVMLMRPEEVGEVTGITQMGGEGAQWIGMAPFTERDHIFQNIGDGTYNHSGSLAMRASAAAGTNITYKLLWNSHIAMTGGQDPVPGLTLENATRELLAEGARRVIITSEDPSRWQAADLPPGVEVWARERIVEAQEALAAIPGMTVLVHDQECASELRRRRRRGRADEPPMRVVINEQVCEGCGDCGEKSNCLSVHPVETEFGRKTQIHQASCNKDYSCLKGDCPSFLTVIPANASRRKSRSAPPLGPDDLPAPAVPAVLGDEFGVRISGVGGTGIVTVAQTLGTAALLDGLHVRGLDQTGLAQKGGPVISDLKLTAAPVVGANKAAAADCDLYLAADLLVGASRPHLVAADPQRTIAVISTARVPTGRMIVDTSASFPDSDGLIQRILGRSVRDRGVQLDAQALAQQLFGTDVVANMLLVGAAYQAGALPLAVTSVESAIELNGAAVELNLQAFRRGRQAVADPGALQAAVDTICAPSPPPVLPPRAREIAAAVRAEPGSELERAVTLRVAELIAYQDPAYAASYAREIERVRAVEADRVPGESGLARAVAFHLHKLMAYKDEYEVARLHLDPRLRSEVQAQFGPDAKISWRLHPPMLRALGMQRKVELGEWFGTGLRALAAMRRLRGTRLDPFGYTRVRRVERELIGEYRALIDDVAGCLNADNHAVAVELARLPDLIRGYEEIKLRGVERYRARVIELRPQLDRVPAATVTSSAPA